MAQGVPLFSQEEIRAYAKITAKGAEYFRGKFTSSLPDSGFKRRATLPRAVRIGELGSNQEDGNKRRKRSGETPEEYGLRDAKLYSELKTLFLSKIKSSEEAKVEEAERTRKVPHE